MIILNYIAVNDWINGYHLPGDLIIDETLDFHQVDQIFKIFIMATPKQESLLKSIHKLGYMRYHGDQLIVEPIEKYQGILKMVDILKGNPQDIVVFGDVTLLPDSGERYLSTPMFAE